jgi:microcystin-dependent protein
MSTTYGSGDGSTTFNLPDKTGRISAMKEASATRLTSTYFVGNSTTLGAVGGSESNTLTSAQIPAHTHPNTLNDPGHTHGIHTNSAGGTGRVATSGPGDIGTDVSDIVSAATGMTITNASNTGGGGAHANVQPTIICNYIIRII